MHELIHHSTTSQDGPASFDVRFVESSGVAELYINIRPNSARTGDDPTAMIYRHLAELLREHSARIFTERVFASPSTAAAVLLNRNEGLGDLDDGVAPTILLAPPSPVAPPGPQIQIHAVRSGAAPEPIVDDGMLIGRRINLDGRSWIHLAALTFTDSANPSVQTRQVYERAARVLREQDMDFRCVARTWVWLRDVLHWYPEFNVARTAVYEDEGLVATDNHAHFLPASTGIGVAPADGGACGLELIAVSDGCESIRSSEAAGEQCSAFSYGSAFARAVVAPMPSGEALLISGTAAIDPDGASEHPSDIRRQIDATLQHLRSLIAEAGWSEKQIVSAIGYCKTPEVASVFAEEWGSLAWPRVEIIGDVCRAELLFEMEVLAADGGNDGG